MVHIEVGWGHEVVGCSILGTRHGEPHGQIHLPSRVVGYGADFYSEFVKMVEV